jgi:maleate isomerase
MIDQQAMNKRARARIGVIVPFSNTNLESDMILLRPADASLHFARAGGYDLEATPDSDQMRKFALASLEPTVASLMAVRPHVILYGCTSATISHGRAFDLQFADAIERQAGVPAVTAAGALVEAVESLGVRKIAFSSPYVEALNREVAEFLVSCGFQTVSRAYVGEDLGNYGQGALTPEEIFDLGCRADHRDAEVLVLSCTDIRAVEAIEALERHLRKPVVTSNQALMFCAAKRLGLALPGTPRIGSLFTGAVRVRNDPRPRSGGEAGWPIAPAIGGANGCSVPTEN